MLLKNLIKHYPQNLKKFSVQGLAINSNDVKKGFIFLLSKETNQMVKIILIKLLKMEQI